MVVFNTSVFLVYGIFQGVMEMAVESWDRALLAIAILVVGTVVGLGVDLLPAPARRRRGLGDERAGRRCSR